MKKSILQEEKKCFVTGREYGLHKHHIYGGGNRKISEKYGFFVYLIPELHNMSNKGVHFNKEFDMYLKKLCQVEFEKTHKREEFMNLIGRNYL
ncbi:MAG: hypothetical protein ACLULK_01705 [Anaerovoracaceae bacterium]